MKCRKVLALKYWSGLNKPLIINADNIDKELSPMISKALIRDLYANALTVLNNNLNIIPVKNLQNLRIASIAINRDKLSAFQKRIDEYYPADHFFIDPSDSTACRKTLKRLKEYDLVIAGIFNLDQRPNHDFGIKPGLDEFLAPWNNHLMSWGTLGGITSVGLGRAAEVTIPQGKLRITAR